MIHERSHLKNNGIVSPEKKNQIKDTKSVKSPHIIEQQINSHQVNSLHQPLWFWERHSRWSYFGRGLFWGGVISSIAIFSAGCGVALTKIDAVEQAIAQRINRNTPKPQSVAEPGLSRPVNILLMEIEPDADNDDNIVKFSHTFVGRSKTILLLKFKPQMGLAQVINIPTDSRVKIPGFGWGTIAEANQYGGTPLVSQIVAQLLDGITIDRYVRAMPQTFQQLSASSKLTLNYCDSRIQDCSRISEQIVRQQTAFETIRQRFNIPTYLADFKVTVQKVKPNLDTNLSVPEIMTVAKFVGELESDTISVDLLPGYIPGKTLATNKQSNHPRLMKGDSSIKTTFAAPINKYYSFQNLPITVQNTTDSLELGRQFMAYLRRQNFQDVYLAEHISLKSNKTKNKIK